MLKVKMAKIRRSGFAFCSMMVAAALVGSLGLASGAAAQDGQTEEAKKRPPPGWIKLCREAPNVQEGGEKENVCLTHQELIDRNTGRTVVSAAIRQFEGQENRSLLVQVPLGMALSAGILARIDENDPIKLQYSLCHVGGCTAATEATDEVLKQLKQGGKMDVAAVNPNGKPVRFRLSLSGFTKAYTGDPVDNKKYRAAMQKRMKAIRQRQLALMEKARKQQQQQQNTEGQQ